MFCMAVPKINSNIALFPCKFRYLTELVHYVLITALGVGEETFRTVLCAVGQKLKIAAAFIRESIKRTETEKTVKTFCIRCFVARKVFTVGVEEKFITVFHNSLLELVFIKF